MVYGTYNELVTGANLNQLITGGHHIVGTVVKIPFVIICFKLWLKLPLMFFFFFMWLKLPFIIDLLNYYLPTHNNQNMLMW